jgi:hypothetical protein
MNESDPIPAGVWEKEKREPVLFQGPCVRCKISHRELFCGVCVKPLCSICLIEHKKEGCPPHEKP